MFSCPDHYRCLKRTFWTIGWCFLVFGFCARLVLGNQRPFLSIFSRLSSLDFSWQRYTLWLWNLSACLVKNRWSVESWDSLSFSFAHYLEDYFSHAIEKTSFVYLSFLFPLKDWFGFLFIACSLVIGFPHFHHHGVGPFWKVKNVPSFKSIFIFENIENQLLKLLKKNR